MILSHLFTFGGSSDGDGLCLELFRAFSFKMIVLFLILDEVSLTLAIRYMVKT